MVPSSYRTPLAPLRRAFSALTNEWQRASQLAVVAGLLPSCHLFQGPSPLRDAIKHGSNILLCAEISYIYRVCPSAQ